MKCLESLAVYKKGAHVTERKQYILPINEFFLFISCKKVVNPFIKYRIPQSLRDSLRASHCTYAWIAQVNCQHLGIFCTAELIKKKSASVPSNTCEPEDVTQLIFKTS